MRGSNFSAGLIDDRKGSNHDETIAEPALPSGKDTDVERRGQKFGNHGFEEHRDGNDQIVKVTHGVD